MPKKTAKKATRTKPTKITVVKCAPGGTTARVLVTDTFTDVFELFEKLRRDPGRDSEASHEAAKKALAAICPELFGAGIYKVHASYNGEGDSGNIDHVFASDVNGNYMPWPKSVENWREKIEQLFWEFIPSGFEINDGSMGELTLTLNTNKLEREHNERLIEYDSHKKTFDL